MPMEVGKLSHLFPGNYLLYGILGFGFHRLLLGLGVMDLAVHSLQRMDAILGAGGLAVYFYTLRAMGGKRFMATFGTVLLGVSYAYAAWSTEAENYILSTFLLLCLFSALITHLKIRPVNGVLIGLCHGMALTGHVVNGLAMPAVLCALWVGPPSSRLKRVASYLITVALFFAFAYGLTLYLVKKPASLADAWAWFLGSAGGKEGAVAWHGQLSLTGLWLYMKMTVQIFIGPTPAYTSPSALWICAAALFVGKIWLLYSIGTVLWHWKTLWLKERALVTVCLAWFFGYALVFTSWEPGTMVYRLSDLVPLWTLIILYWISVKAPPPADVTFLTVLFALANIGGHMVPRSYPSNNPNLARMAMIKASTQPGDWVAGNGGLDEIYIPYFAERYPLVLGQYAGREKDLKNRIDGLLKAKQRIFVTSRVLDDVKDREVFKAYRLRQSTENGSADLLYRLEAVPKP